LKSALIVYFSSAENTQKVAYAIKDGLEAGDLKVELKKQLKIIFTIMIWCVWVRLRLIGNQLNPYLIY
jgi:flavodoxin